VLINIYAIEKKDGSVFVHSFNDREFRAAWIAEDSKNRAAALAHSRPVHTAIFDCAVIAHEKPRGK
jgi:hypothetical protein